MRKTINPAQGAQNEKEEKDGILTLDVFQKDDEIIIRSAIAGVAGKNLDISIKSDTVTIAGERKSEEEIKEENYFYQELHWGRFSRSVILPEEVDPDKARATLKNGVLTIILPKMNLSKSKKVEVT